MIELYCNAEKDDEIDLEEEEITEDEPNAEGNEEEEEEDEDECAFVGTFRIIALGMTEEEVGALIGKYLDEQFNSVELEVNAEE